MKTGTIPEVPNSPTSSIGNSTASFDVTQSCDLKNNPRYQLDQWTDMPILYISLHKDFFVSLSGGPYPFKKLHVLHCVNPALIHFLFDLSSKYHFSIKWIVNEGDPTWTVTLGKCVKEVTKCWHAMLTRDLARTRNRLVKENSSILITIHLILKMKMMEHGRKMELRKK